MPVEQANEEILSVDEYIAGELKSEVRHDYFDGRVSAMADTNVMHCTIAGNFFGEIGRQLRGKKCEAFNSDMKVHFQNFGDDGFYYPDVMVNCDPAGQQPYFCDTPCLIVEVVSPETEQIDRREKWFAYRKLASLHTYILASQEKREVTVYHREGDGWRKTILIGDSTLTVPEMEFSVRLDALYAQTEL
jgi:Uma2 family endonuclease